MKCINLNYNILSKYRTELMGISILWVMFYHSNVEVHLTFLKGIKEIGYGGVDIFFLLSGLGLYYSYHKNKSISSFYKRRVLRILPTYLPVVFVFSLLFLLKGIISFHDFIMNITTLSFWFNTNYKFDWFIPALIGMYLMAPFILSTFFKQVTVKGKYLVIGLGILSSIITSLLLISQHKEYLLIFTSRIPSFLIGILIGYFSRIAKTLTRRSFIINQVLLLVGVLFLAVVFKQIDEIYLWKYGLWWWPFNFIVLPLCLGLGYCLSLINTVSKLRFIKFCGKHSLELYLFHERVLILIPEQLFKNRIILNLVAFLLTLTLAFLWKIIINRFLNV